MYESRAAYESISKGYDTSIYAAKTDNMYNAGSCSIGCYHCIGCRT